MAEEMQKRRPKIVILLGPSGVGKSKLAIELAGELGGEIISADSMQVYRYMDIGTAKPTPEEQEKVRHHMIDLVDPDQPFHAGLYRILGRQTVEQLDREKITAWVVGGTGLYIKTLTQGLFSIPQIDPAVREHLKQEATAKGGTFLYERLKRVDPLTASRLHTRDLFRTIRALEVFDSTGVPISVYRQQHRFEERPYHTLKIGLEMDRSTLYQRIDRRVDQMIERGLLQEVKKLLEMGFGPSLKPMQGLGYKQLVQFLSQSIGWDEAILQIKGQTRHYAKRQVTWFKSDPEIHWFKESSEREKIKLEINSFLEREEGDRT